MAHGVCICTKTCTDNITDWTKLTASETVRLWQNCETKLFRPKQWLTLLRKKVFYHLSPTCKNLTFTVDACSCLMDDNSRLLFHPFDSACPFVNLSWICDAGYHYRVFQKTDTHFFWDNFGNSAPILIILSLLQAEIYGA